VHCGQGSWFDFPSGVECGPESGPHERAFAGRRCRRLRADPGFRDLQRQFADDIDCTGSVGFGHCVFSPYRNVTCSNACGSFGSSTYLLWLIQISSYLLGSKVQPIRARESAEPGMAAPKTAGTSTDDTHTESSVREKTGGGHRPQPDDRSNPGNPITLRLRHFPTLPTVTPDPRSRIRARGSSECPGRSLRRP